MWLKISSAPGHNDQPGANQIIGSTTQYGGHSGFVLYSNSLTYDSPVGGPDDCRLSFMTRDRWMGDSMKVLSRNFPMDTWTHVAVNYKNAGEDSSAEILINTAGLKGPVQPIGWSPDLRIGDQGWGSTSGFSVYEMRSYSRVLTDTETLGLFMSDAGVFGLTSTDIAAHLDTLASHVRGDTTLTDAEIKVATLGVQAGGALVRTDEPAMQAMLNLFDDYEASGQGPLFMTPVTAGGIDRVEVAGEADHAELELVRAMVAIHQMALDQLYGAATAKACGSCLFDGRGWLTSAYFPGASPLPADAAVVHGIGINATVPRQWGRRAAFDIEAARKPTGLYLSPGAMARVSVPQSVVDAGGFTVLVGAHTWSHGRKTVHKRLDRTSTRFSITELNTFITNPLGGGVYIEVPYLAGLGVVQLDVTGGVIEAPYFKLDSWDESRGGTTDEDWLARRTSLAPWADFESDKFMMQVPSTWIFAYDDARGLVRTWDTCMDGVSEANGYPPYTRNKKVVYLIPDVHIQHGAHGIGYPQTNSVYNPATVLNENGNANHWFIQNPRGNQIEYHEMGHSQGPYYYRGEGEAIVNLLHAYVANVKFGVPLDQAFQESFNPAYGNPGFAPDEAAIHWMATLNFQNSAEMDHSNTQMDQFRYQERGYAKYVDVAEMFGWSREENGALWRFYLQVNLDVESGTFEQPFTPEGVAYGRGLSDTDIRTLRLSIAAGVDLTPLIHFWGIDPDDATLLASETANLGLGRSRQVHDMLIERATVVLPQNNSEFLDHFERVYPGMPTGGNPLYGSGWYDARRDNWDEGHAAGARVTIQEILNLYFPPAASAQTWTHQYLEEQDHGVNASMITERCYVALYVAADECSDGGVYKIVPAAFNAWWSGAAANPLDNQCGEVSFSVTASWAAALFDRGDLLGLDGTTVLATYQAGLQKPGGCPAKYCPAGYGDYGVRSNWATGRITIASSAEACAARCTQYSGVQFAGGCKAYMTGMYYGMLYCRSYGGNFRTQPCASWAVPTDPGIGSGQLGTVHQRTGTLNVGGNCCSNTSVVKEAISAR